MGILDPLGLELNTPYHWGIVVADLDRAARAWTSMPGCGAFAVMDWEMDATYRGTASAVAGRLGYAPLAGGGYVELVQPVRGEWTAATWLRERGEGPYHVGYWADGLDAALERLAAAGTVADTVAGDGEGAMFAYLDTVAELGVHTELVRDSLRPMLTAFIAGAQPE